MEPDINNPEQIKQLIQMLQQLLPQENNITEAKPKKQKAKKRKVDEFDNPNIKTKSPKRVHSNVNKFLEMPERNLHKEDSIIDKKLSKNPPTPRNRQFIPLDVVCRVCGKREQVNPAIIPESADRYKCNKCSSTAGG